MSFWQAKKKFNADDLIMSSLLSFLLSFFLPFFFISFSIFFFCFCFQLYVFSLFNAWFRASDDLVIIMAYIIVYTPNDHLYAELNLLDDFIDEFSLNAEPGFCLTILQTALQYLHDTDPDAILQTADQPRSSLSAAQLTPQPANQ